MITLQAEVLNITSNYEGSLIYSHVALLVTLVMTGPGMLEGTHIILRVLGGEVNGTLFWLSSQPYFFVGERVEISVQQEGGVYLPTSPKKTLTGALRLATTAGYVLEWYKPGVGWQSSTTRPGSDWYGPLKWSGGTFDYWINPQSIPSDLSTPSFVSYTTASFQTWQDDPDSAIAFTYRGTRTDLGAGSEDSVNMAGWGYLGGSTIAVTYMWGQYTPGSFDSLRFTETDMIFDNSKLWSAQPSGIAGRYDIQNIGTHEAGHTFGLGDMYESADAEHTMYGYGSTGETKKRSLEWGDRAGVAALYPQAYYVLHVWSSPITGVLISLGSPPTPYSNTNFDISSSNSFSSGPFTAASSVVVGASTYLFDHWELDGVNKGANPLVTVYVGSGYPNERTAVAVYALAVTATVTSRSTVTSTSYLSMTTTHTTTRYTSTSTLTSTIPTTTTVALILSTVTSIVQSIEYLTSILTTTLTSYTGTQTSTSTVLVPTTVTVGPSTMTTTVEATEVLTSTGSTTVTRTTTTTLTSYTDTVTSTSTVVVPTTVTLGPSTMTTTVQTTEVLTSTGTSTVTAVTTTTVGAYTSTTTSTSTSVVYTTVTVAGAGGSAPLAYFGFLSLLAVAVGHGAATSKGFNMQRIRLCMGRRWSSD